MEITGVGGGLMLAIAAALWLIYLVPSWLKRREYLATEKNAVRLQQTIRVLAETAEVPAVMRAARAQPIPVAVGRPVTLREPIADARALASRRLRRTRAITALALLGALVMAVAQVSLIITSGAVAGSWVVLGIALLAAVTTVGVLSRLASVSRARVERVERPARRTSLGRRQRAEAAPVVTAWTPVPLPKPLYLSRPVAPAEFAAPPIEEAIAASVQAIRDAEREVAALRPASRFASMGIVSAAPTEAPDLDAVLARRRAAG